ncbi:hypothetical protein NKI59_22345 [Mesorhizobium sp. M0598]|uniref:hypothetical protein n=1 Tax=Mesorhizobium sp. M0598 TaxID=2956968 RepID=UPI003337C417
MTGAIMTAERHRFGRTFRCWLADAGPTVIAASGVEAGSDRAKNLLVAQEPALRRRSFRPTQRRADQGLPFPRN